MPKLSIVKKATFEVFGALFDVLLWQVFLTGASVGKTGSRGVYQAFREADEMIAKVNHRTLAQVWCQLMKKKLISYKKRSGLYSPEITALGKKRLQETIPQYHSNRPWDGKIYLVTYDIPENFRRKRDLLRYFLQKTHCKFLQKSIWITPYNPRELINDYIQLNKIPGTIIVSDTGSDGGIGESTIQNLIVKLYQLEDINDKYDKFIKDVRSKEKPVNKLLLRYLAVLSDDPQLPFPLIPENFLAEKAQKLYQKLLANYILSVPRSRKQ